MNTTNSANTPSVDDGVQAALLAILRGLGLSEDASLDPQTLEHIRVLFSKEFSLTATGIQALHQTTQPM